MAPFLPTDSRQGIHSLEWSSDQIDTIVHSLVDDPMYRVGKKYYLNCTCNGK
jgi:hypothetical protein